MPDWTAPAAWIVAALSLFGLLIRQIGPWKKQVSEVEEHLRSDLLARVGKLERKLDRMRVLHDAERAHDRHRLNNITQCFDGLLMLIKANPSKAAEAVAMIEELRAKQLIAENEERAIIQAALIAGRAEDQAEAEDE